MTFRGLRYTSTRSSIPVRCVVQNCIVSSTVPRYGVTRRRDVILCDVPYLYRVQDQLRFCTTCTYVETQFNRVKESNATWLFTPFAYQVLQLQTTSTYRYPKTYLVRESSKRRRHVYAYQVQVLYGTVLYWYSTNLVSFLKNPATPTVQPWVLIQIFFKNPKL